jgi:hypothetical protein
MTNVLEHETEVEDRLRPGTKVEVRKRFDASWARGFEVAEVVTDGYLVRRLSDGDVLPLAFPPAEVRRERKKGMWWY